MQSVAGAAAGALRMRDKNGADPEGAEVEHELNIFERTVRLVDTRRYRGIKRCQVEIWLLFEDQSSSVYAKVRSAASVSAYACSRWQRRR